MLLLKRASLLFLVILASGCGERKRSREEAVKDARSQLETYCVREKCDASAFSLASAQLTDGEWFVQFVERQERETHSVSFVFTKTGFIETSRKREPTTDKEAK